MKRISDLPTTTSMVNDSKVIVIATDNTVSRMELELFKGTGTREGFISANPYETLRNDVSFITGDYITINNLNTPIMFGPYLRGQPTSILAAPFLTVMRGPVQHAMTADDFGVDDSPNTAATSYTVTKVVTGDTMLVNYQENSTDTGKQVIYTATVDYGTSIIDWGESTNVNGVVIHTVTDRVLNNELYSDGDYAILNDSLLLGPYDNSANQWAIHNELRPSHEYSINADDWGVDDIPSTSSTDFSSPSIITGDTMRVKYQTSSVDTGKQLIYRATVSYDTFAVTWELIGNPIGTVTHELTDNQPDNERFSNGDWGILTNGNRLGPYNVNDSVWPIHTVIQNSIMQINDDANGLSYLLKTFNGALYLEEI